MGSYSRNSPEPVIDKSWWTNDGLVNVVSSRFPFGQPNKPFNGSAKKGEWNYFSVQKGWDHMDYVGIDAADTVGINGIYRFYDGIANNLQQLPE